MAKRSSSHKGTQGSSAGNADDAFTARILELIAWGRSNQQALVVGTVVVVLAIAAGTYWLTQRDARFDAAASQLEALQQNVPFEDPQTAATSVQSYIDRFGGTSYAIEARLLLARVHLTSEGNPAAAITTLEAVVPSTETPLHTQATFMLASAYEQAERWNEAANVYEELRTVADYDFQIRDAVEGLARTRLAQGDTAGAIQAYEGLISEMEADDPERAAYEMRLSELTAGRV